MGNAREATKHGDLVYDVGMHEGEDADFYLRKGFRVIGFEADPELTEHCRNRFSKEIEEKRLVIVEGAIIEHQSSGTRGKTVQFFKNTEIKVWGTVSPDWASRNEALGTHSETIEVTAVNFSDCLEEYGIPHYMKADIEGQDLVCIRSLMHFQAKPDYVSIESNKTSFDSLVEEFNLLTQLGYTKFKAVQQCGISYQREPNPSKERSYIGYCFSEGSSGLFGEDLPLEWKDVADVLAEYRKIFNQYRVFGDKGLLPEFCGRVLSKLLRRPVPGWYDTHAKHQSVVDS